MLSFPRDSRLFTRGFQGYILNQIHPFLVLDFEHSERALS
jgi:hypothetical protein